MASNRSCRIAIVEDEKQYQEMFREYVSRYGRENGIGMEITVFADGLDITEEYSAEWDVIFMDIQMKHMDGMEAARRIRQHDERTAIVFITTLAQYAIHGYEVDALDYVLKPVSYEQFALRMAKALRRLSIEEEKYLVFGTEEGKDKVAEIRILYVEVIGHNLSVHVKKLVNYSGYGTPALESVQKPHCLDADSATDLVFASTGGVTFNGAEVLAQTYNVDLAQRFGNFIGNDGLLGGVTGWYCPAMNIHRTPFSGRNNEYYSEDLL